ncbi:hypothetical protein [Helicobacter cappadocius]|uniref:Outer membrane protein beta-barrel domain-containing protein n=1 Tax=Helicobacter cappadocius TaxID=3063998 RepID=A0AA90T4X9_9HELI|nr:MULTISPECIES: hypothetical protein [unclassified Helicobacter]MDO7252795.1 hypothetical protein [Helicobacter sp. faydin-H75]MDP2538838.1 hypothetical protein [Helicobacter sp. faydin-H76]
MKKVFLTFFISCLVGGFFVNAESVDSDGTDQGIVSEDTQIQSNARGWSWYLDAALDMEFFKISDSNEGTSSSVYGTRDKDSYSMGAQFYVAAGPTYNFTERFGIGAKIGIGAQYFLLGYSGIDYSCYSYSYSSCGYQDKTTFVPVGFGVVVPVAFDVKYSFNKKYGLIGGVGYDFGSTMRHFRMYVGGIFYKNAVIKVGYSHVSLTDSTLKKVSDPSAGSSLYQALGVGGVDLGGGNGNGFYVSVSYMIW